MANPDATERVMELVMYLLSRDTFRTREQIWRDTGLYGPQPPPTPRQLESARAAFERDKSLIRNLGIPIAELMEADGATSYTIRRSDYFLPDLKLTPGEQQALRFAAAQVDIGESWDLEAVVKLTSTETPTADESAEVALSTTAEHRTDGKLLAALAAAAGDRALVRFAYAERQREVQPLALLCRAGHWYLAAQEGGVAKTFRVDRLESDPEIGKPGAFKRQKVDVAALLPTEPMEIGSGDDLETRVRIDATMAQQPTVARGRVIETHDDGSVTVTARVRNRAAFRMWLLDMGRHAVVESPPELVDDIKSWLRALADVAPGAER